MGSRGDRIKLVIAILSAGLIAFIILKNYPGKIKKMTTTEDYYVTEETVERGTSDGSSYYAMNSNGRLQCPGLDNTSPKGSSLNVASLRNNANQWLITKMPFTRETLNFKYVSVTKDTVAQLDIKQGGKGTITDIVDSPTLPLEGGYYEIIAPFSYSFLNTNLDDSKSNTIIIKNANGTCRMTVENAANWFCAGTVGTETVYTNTSDTAPKSWAEHSQKHMTKIGASSTVKSSGSAGELIGYGDNDTVIKFEAYVNGAWGEVSLYELVNNVKLTGK